MILDDPVSKPNHNRKEIIWFNENNSLNAINVVVIPTPFPKAATTIDRIMGTVLDTAPPEKRKIPVSPTVRPAYPITVSQ